MPATRPTTTKWILIPSSSPRIPGAPPGLKMAHGTATSISRQIPPTCWLRKQAWSGWPKLPATPPWPLGEWPVTRRASTPCASTCGTRPLAAFSRFAARLWKRCCRPRSARWFRSSLACRQQIRRSAWSQPSALRPGPRRCRCPQSIAITRSTAASASGAEMCGPPPSTRPLPASLSMVKRMLPQKSPASCSTTL